MDTVADPRALRRPEDLPSGARELAELCSLAVRVQPELLRAVRLDAAPHLTAGDEADVWAAPIVAGRSPAYLSFHAAALQTLRHGLAQRLLLDPEPVRRAHRAVRELHVHEPPALRLEEQIAWLFVSRGEDALPDMERTLGTALLTLVEQERWGLARWWPGAWSRLPPPARRTATAAQLCVITSPVLGADAVTPPSGIQLDARLEVALHGVPDVAVGVLREGRELLLGEVDRARGAAILVPDTHPRWLELEWSDDQPAPVGVHCLPGEDEEQARRLAALLAARRIDVSVEVGDPSAGFTRLPAHRKPYRDVLVVVGRTSAGAPGLSAPPPGVDPDQLGTVVLPGAGAVELPPWLRGRVVRLHDLSARQVESVAGMLARPPGPPAAPRLEPVTETLAIAAGAVVRRRVGTGAVRLRTARGTVYDVPADVARQVPFLRTPGVPALGAHWDGTGTHFGLFSGVAEGVELCLIDASGEESTVSLDHRHDGLWHAFLPGVGPGQRYGYRVHGPYDPARGLRCNPHKLLLDPYCRATESSLDWHPSLFGYRVDEPSVPDHTDSAPHMMRSVVVDPTFDWGDDRPPGIPADESVLYEAHVKGLTQTHPGIPPELRGTFAGVAHPAILEHLTGLGVTAVELMPVHQFVHEAFLVERGLSNYWGYNSIAFFAPHSAYSASGQLGQQVEEFKSMVRALHSASIEVILDVAYNHTAEGNHLGPTLSFRGIDNRVYYRLVDGAPDHYLDYTASGNTLNVGHARPLQLLMDSLRYWVTEMHVDGFRFDLAASLARQFHEVDRLSTFFSLIQQDPVVSRVKLIAEPWDVGEGGYQVGNFPELWSEWNGRYRDTVRDFWRGEGGIQADFASRLAGSADLYGQSGRGPSASVNFVTSHDGFTLQDLVSYDEKHNEANGEGNADGESYSRSWNCGVEGPTDDPEVNALRRRQRRNFIATLLLSQGVPMLLHGDELGRTQRGNNNVFAQDNEMSWMDWTAGEQQSAFLEFTRRLIRLRRQHPAFRRRRHWAGRPVGPGTGPADLVWLAPSGREMSDDDWSTGEGRSLGVYLDGSAITERDPRGRRIGDDSFLLLFNAEPQVAEFTLPPAPYGRRWSVVVDTDDERGVPDVPSSVGAGDTVLMASPSVIVLRREG